MENDRIIESWKSWKNSQIKFDYYVLGIAAALLTYLASDLEIDPEAIYQTWFEAIAALFVLVSLISGLYRLLHDLSLQSINFQQLVKAADIKKCKEILGRNQDDAEFAAEVRDYLKRANADLDKSKVVYKAKGKCFAFLFDLRNYSLLLAFLIILSSKFYAVIIETCRINQIAG